MSKTYIDQLRYDAKNYYSRQPNLCDWFGPFLVFMGHPKKDLNEPIWRTLSRSHAVDNYGGAGWWRRWSNRKYRRMNRQLIRKGREDEINKRPTDIDYHLW